MTQQRPLIPAKSSVTDAPAAQRPTVPKTVGTSAKSAPLVPRRAVSPSSAPLVPRQIIARKESQDPFVLVEDFDEEAYLARPAFVPKVKLGDQDVAGAQLQQAVRDLQVKKKRCRRIQLEEVVRTDLCFVSGCSTSSREVTVGYKRSTKPNSDPKMLERLSETPQTSLPIIRYPEGERFGSNLFLELTDDTYGTPFTTESGDEVEICFAGMSLSMERKDDHWVYWPHDRSDKRQNFPLRGKVTQDLVEARYLDPPTEPITRESDVDGDQIAFMLEVAPNEVEEVDGEEIITFLAPYVFIIVTLLTGEKRAIKVPYNDSFFA